MFSLLYLIRDLNLLARHTQKRSGIVRVDPLRLWFLTGSASLRHPDAG